MTLRPSCAHTNVVCQQIFENFRRYNKGTFKSISFRTILATIFNLRSFGKLLSRTASVFFFVLYYVEFHGADGQIYA